MKMIRMLILALFLVSSAIPILSEIAYPKNCKELLDQGAPSSGIHTIKPDASPEPFFVYCNMEIQDGGWVYVINRKDGSENFTRPWVDYKYGFGNIAREFWLGLDHLHELTVTQVNELLVELIDWDLNQYHIHYKAFSIDSEERDYRLQILGGYTGDLADSLTYHGGGKFSTFDRDNDNFYGNSCANSYGRGGWWYRHCFSSQLTGLYLAEEEAIEGNQTGINWRGIGGINNLPFWYSFKEARMMVRPQTDHALT